MLRGGGRKQPGTMKSRWAETTCAWSRPHRHRLAPPLPRPPNHHHQNHHQRVPNYARSNANANYVLTYSALPVLATGGAAMPSPSLSRPGIVSENRPAGPCGRETACDVPWPRGSGTAGSQCLTASERMDPMILWLFHLFTDLLEAAAGNMRAAMCPGPRLSQTRRPYAGWHTGGER